VTAPRLTAIAAVGANGVIGDGTRMPWHLPEDLAHFKRVTMGGVLAMGRRTYESLGRPLPGRTTIVITGNPAWYPAGGVPLNQPPRTYDVNGLVVHVTDSAAMTLAVMGQYATRTWWSIGGGQIYRLLWDYTTDLDITAVHASPAGTVTFPHIAPGDWAEVSREPGSAFDRVTYRRRADAAARLIEAAGLP